MKKASLSILAAVAAVQAFTVNASGAERVAAVEKDIIITVGNSEFTAVLEENAAASALRQKLPLTVRMYEQNGNEKYCDLRDRLSVNAISPGNIRSGDLMLFGASYLVLFYRDIRTSYTYTRLGRIDDPRGLEKALGSGNPLVRFTVAGKRPHSGEKSINKEK